jgi:hypothetical protein
MYPHSLFKSIAASLAIAASVGPSVLSAQQPANESAGSKVEHRAHVLRVTNNNWLDVHIYVSRDGGLLRPLGVVGSGQSEEFAFPAGTLDLGRVVRIVADPIGGRGIYASGDVTASPGDEVVLVVENALPLSFISVRALGT